MCSKALGIPRRAELIIQPKSGVFERLEEEGIRSREWCNLCVELFGGWRCVGPTSSRQLERLTTRRLFLTRDFEICPSLSDQSSNQARQAALLRASGSSASEWETRSGFVDGRFHGDAVEAAGLCLEVLKIQRRLYWLIWNS